MKQPVIVIAEVGVNHNGDMGLARQLIREAKNAGADVVKFQAFNPDELVSRHAVTAEYQKKNAGEDNQLEMLRKLSLKAEDFAELSGICKEIGIEFMCSPFDIPSLEILLKLNVNTIKIPSGEITNLPFLRKIGEANKEVILSTGMSTIEEAREAIDILVQSGNARSKIVVLHCTSEYPAPPESLNLRAMQSIGNELKVKIGYSDHSEGIEASLAAVALGATIIEKHFTLDRNLPGPDHVASLDPKQLKSLVDGIRFVELALGSSQKFVVPAEEKNLSIVRKSITAKKFIKKGDAFSEDNLTTKRPGTGISPMKWDLVLGQKANRDFSEDEVISLD